MMWEQNLKSKLSVAHPFKTLGFSMPKDKDNLRTGVGEVPGKNCQVGYQLGQWKSVKVEHVLS